jgi:formate dehydrogenase major subunit
MNINVSRRTFLRGVGVGVGGTTLSALGFDGIESAHAAAVKAFRLTSTKEARSTCPYCAVSCGMMVFSAESRTEPGKLEVVHIEGDADHPVNRGTLCPKGAAAIDYVRARARVKQPMYRKPGGDRLKDDRDANFIERNSDGVLVNRWPTMGFLSGSSCTNETGWMTWKTTRGLGILQLENQARI